MSLVGEWRVLQAGLPEGWMQVSVQLEIRDPEAVPRAAALLGPAGPYRTAVTVLRFNTARDGSAQGPDGIARLLRRLDDARIGGTLSALGSERAVARPERAITSLAESWDAALAGLPADWSDLVAEVRLLSSDYEAMYFRPLSTDLDPAGNMDFWTSGGSGHIWNLEEKVPATPWEAQIDAQMAKQASEIDPEKRKAMFNDVQKIFAENLPALYFVAPRIYYAHNARVLGVTPSVQRPPALWSADTIGVRSGAP